MDKQSYQKYASASAKKSNLPLDCTKAFFFGGLICTFGQLLFFLYTLGGLDEERTRILVPCTLIFLTAILTGIGVFDRIAKHAGAGTLVPITGFANAVCAPAIDTRAEGMILGLGAKIFTIAGPVILFGTFASSIYGLIYWLFTL